MTVELRAPICACDECDCVTYVEDVDEVCDMCLAGLHHDPADIW